MRSKYIKTTTNLSPSQAILKGREICKSFDGQIVLDEIDFEIIKGDVILLTGSNGSGKTTLLNILAGIEIPDSGTISVNTNRRKWSGNFSRSFRYSNIFETQFTPEFMNQSGVIRSWQNPRAFNNLNVIENVAIAFPKQIREKLLSFIASAQPKRLEKLRVENQSREILKQVDLLHKSTEMPENLSLGQAKRLDIGRALNSQSEILLLDEVCSGLDERGISEFILYCIKSLETGLTIVLSEHAFNLSKIKPLLDVVTKIWHLNNGQLRVQLPDSINSIFDEIPNGIAGWITHLSNSGSAVSEQKLSDDVKLVKIAVPGRKVGIPVLEINDLHASHNSHIRYAKEKSFSFTINAGEIAVLLAPNGWGKTTLLESIAGIIPLIGGSIKLQGTDLNGLQAWERRKLGLTFLQAQENAFSNLTVKENFRLEKNIEVPAELSQWAERIVSTLSGGERQRVALERLLCRNDYILSLLDEPFASLDERGIKKLSERLLSLNDKAVLIADAYLSNF